MPLKAFEETVCLSVGRIPHTVLECKFACAVQLAEGTVQAPSILDRHSEAQPCLFAAQDLTVRSVEEQVGNRVDVELDFLVEVYLQGQYRVAVSFPTVNGGDNCHASRQR